MTEHTPTANLCKPDLADLEAWAEGVVEAANGWAERAEVSRGERKELTMHLDTIASKARQVASMAAVLNAR
jgi:hypothetical protein